MNWVKLAKYCEMSGETKYAVYGKRRSGAYVDGVHCKLAEDGKLWVNIDMIEQWVQFGQKATKDALNKR